MQKKYFSETGNWYKGNLHSHTVNSDGHFTPAQAVNAYRQHGYSFICFSEHDYYTDLRKEFDRGDFLILPGVEASALLLNEDKSRMLKTHHIHGILGTQEMQQAAGDQLIQHGKRLTPPAYVGKWEGLQTAQKLSDSLRKMGCFTTYNHPSWSRVDAEEICGLEDIWAIEVFNYGTEVECGEGYNTVFWDRMLAAGKRINCFASDDNHNPNRFFDSFGGYVVVRSEELSHEAIVSHLLAGDYYSSAGPEIYQFGIDGDEVFVECSNVACIHFICGGYVGCSETVNRYGVTLKKAFHKLDGTEKYVRIECVNEQGRRAFTNPIYL